jgi:hypothetical protein
VNQRNKRRRAWQTNLAQKSIRRQKRVAAPSDANTDIADTDLWRTQRLPRTLPPIVQISAQPCFLCGTSDKWVWVEDDEVSYSIAFYEQCSAHQTLAFQKRNVLFFACCQAFARRNPDFHFGSATLIDGGAMSDNLVLT